jgi:hypothetical protein
MKTRGKAVARLAAWPVLLALAGAIHAQAVDLGITPAETRYPPTPARLGAIEETAAANGWESVALPLKAAAVQAFGQDRFIAADAWFHVFEWASLFGEPENRFTSSWMDAMTANRVNYAAVSGAYTPGDKPLSTYLSPQMQAWLIENPEFSEQFFSNVTQVDFLPKSFAILDGLHRRSPEKFARYASLCIALALVYDVPPPPYWPHAQVTAEALPRKLLNPAEVFEWLTREDAAGRTYQHLARLRPEELKFTVDIAAPVSELAWSEQVVRFPIDQFEGAYSMVAYRTDRFNSGVQQYVWSGKPYTLQNILQTGGICVDQAYFATQSGKARGLPTLLFGGQGQDGRHAWFGYLDGEGKWRLDAGRYAEQRLVTGTALDPQTWKAISDHELQFLSERFRALPSFAESRVQEEFAGDFLASGDFARAVSAARKAVNYERRNLDAWETLTAATEKAGASPSVLEGVYREAALAFTPKYPDLVTYYENKVVASLRSRGEGSLADYEERGMAERLMGNRDDLAVKQASGILARSLATQSIDGQIATYNAILAQFGHGAGTLFFDDIVRAFAEHLALSNMRPQAREAVERAAETLEVQPGTQIAIDVDKLMNRLRD